MTFLSKLLEKVHKKRYERTGRDIIRTLSEGTHLVRYNPEKLLEEIDRWSEGLVSECRPDGNIKEKHEGGSRLIYIESLITDRKFSWLNPFQLRYKELVHNPGKIAVHLSADYNSPIGPVNLNILTTSTRTVDLEALPKSILKESFPTREEVDVFLKLVNNQTEKIPEEMMREFSASMPGQTTNLEFRIYDTRRSTTFEVSKDIFHGPNSKRFTYHTQDAHLWTISGEIKFENFDYGLDIDKGRVTLDGTLATKLAYRRISIEEVRRAVNQKIEEYFKSNPILRDLPPIELKFVAEATKIDDEGIKGILLKGEEEGVKYKINCTPKKSQDPLGLNDEIEGWHSMVGWKYKNPPGLGNYRGQIHIEQGIDPETGKPKLTLIGDALLTTKLARELSGQENYGLLKAE